MDLQNDFRYFVLLLKEIEMLHSRYNPMDNPRVKMFPLNEKMCNVTSSEAFYLIKIIQSLQSASYLDQNTKKISSDRIWCCQLNTFCSC